MKKALLIIDMQKYEEKSICINNDNTQKYHQLTANINSNIDNTLNNNDIVIYIREEFPNLLFYRHVFPKRSLRGSEDVLIAPSINVKSNIEFTKMFPSAFSNKKLNKFLKENNVDTVEINGMDASCGCAYFTAIEAAKLGYNTIYNISCLSTTWPEKLTKAKEKLSKSKIIFTASIDDMFIFSK